MHMTIGITDTASRFENYPAWIKGGDPDIETIRLTPGNVEDMERCDGIVFSGGVDTHPKFYKNEHLNFPNASKFNEQRDQFELDVLRVTHEKNIPVLAVCRGMQLVNIALGGDLIQDIEASGKQDHRRHGDIDGMHELAIVKDSLLYEITGSEHGMVNSAHHQALG